jgi:hypothetical protein
MDFFGSNPTHQNESKKIGHTQMNIDNDQMEFETNFALCSG